MPRTVTLANGSMLVALDATGALRDLTWPQVGSENHAQGRPLRFAALRNGKGVVLGGPGSSCDHAPLPDTLAAETRFVAPALGLRVCVTDALCREHPLLLRHITVQDDLGQDSEIRLRLHGGFELAESSALNSVVYDPASRTLRFWRRNRHVLLGALSADRPGFTEWLCGHHLLPRGGTPGDALLNPEALTGSTASVGDVDAVGGITLRLQQGRAEAWCWLAVGDSASAVLQLNELALHSASELLSTAMESDRQWVTAHTRPKASNAEFNSAAARSLLLARAHADAGGSIVAAVDSATLEPGRESYAYCWPRDGAFIADTLSASGDRALATNFFRYCARLEKHDGALLQRYHPDGTVASSWMATLEDNAPVLPVQADETALVLWALHRHLGRHPERRLLLELRDTLLQPCTEFLLRWRGAEGLPLPSVDLWEERRGIHAFTTAATIAGLRAAANLLEQCSRRRLASTARSAAELMQAVLLSAFRSHEGLPRSFAIEGGCVVAADLRIDASLLGMQLLGVLAPDDALAARIRVTCADKLRVPTWVGGLARYENDQYLRTAELGQEIPGNPWPLVSLLLARAHAEAGERDQACALLSQVLQRRGPCGTLAEQHHPTSGAPMGVEPLAWAHATLADAVAALH